MYASEQIEDHMVLVERAVPIGRQARAQMKQLLVDNLISGKAVKEGELQKILGTEAYGRYADWQASWPYWEAQLERYTFALGVELHLDGERMQILRRALALDPPWEWYRRLGEDRWLYTEQLAAALSLSKAESRLLYRLLTIVDHGTELTMRTEQISEALSLTREDKLRLQGLLEPISEGDEMSFLIHLLRLSPLQAMLLYAMQPLVDREVSESWKEFRAENPWIECGSTIEPAKRERVERRLYRWILTPLQMERFLDYQAGILPADFGFATAQERDHFIDTYFSRPFQTVRSRFRSYLHSPKPPETESNPPIGTDFSNSLLYELWHDSPDEATGVRPLRRYFQHHAILIYLWASWCETCVAELDSLSKVSDHLRGSGLEVVAINMDSERTRSAAKRILASRERAFEAVDGHESYIGWLQLHGLPRTFFAGPDGRAIGFRDPRSRKRVTRVIGERPWSSPEYLDALADLLRDALQLTPIGARARTPARAATDR